LDTGGSLLRDHCTIGASFGNALTALVRLMPMR
jgi:hypothetical protein